MGKRRKVAHQPDFNECEAPSHDSHPTTIEKKESRQTATKPVSAVEVRKRALGTASSPTPSPRAGRSDRNPEEYATGQRPSPKTEDVSSLLDISHSQPSSETRNAPYLASQSKLSSWTPQQGSVSNVNAHGMTAILACGETLACVGVYDVSIKRGVVSLYGAILRAGTDAHVHRVFGSASHALPVVQCHSPDGAEIQFRSADPGLPSFDILSPLYARLWKSNKHTDTPSLGDDTNRWTFENIRASSDDVLGRPLHRLDVSPKWSRVIQKICSTAAGSESVAPGKILVCGPRNTGKSTFAKVLLNRMCTIDHEAVKASGNPAFLLDIDPGQPEYSVPGQMSLIMLQRPIFGPPFTHPMANTGPHQRAIRSHYIWANSPKDSPEYFVDCVVDLVTHYYKLLDFGDTNGPLIINSFGWVVGIGIQILTSLIARISLTDVVYSSDEPGRSLDAIQDAATAACVPSFHTIPSQLLGPTTAIRTAAEFRDMQMLSYFHLATPDPASGTQSWDPTPLAARKPYVLAYATIRNNDEDDDDDADDDPTTRDFLAIVPVGDPLEPDTLAVALDGAIVGIVAICPTAGPTSLVVPAIDRTPLERIPFVSHPPGSGVVELLPPPHISQLVCLGLVRGIDVARRALHLLVPAACEHLVEGLVPERTLLVLGDGTHATPGWAYLEDVHVDANAAVCTQRPWVQRMDGGGRVEVDGGSGSGMMGAMGKKRRLRRFVNC